MGSYFFASPYLELTRPRVVAMVLATTAAGFYLGGRGVDDGWRLAVTVAGIGLTSGGAAALNAYLERDYDAQMARTCRRALPAGRIPPARALRFGAALVAAGVALLAVRVNPQTAFLGLLAAFLYVLVYTPLKRLTWLNTSVGAIPGAIPPLAGWVAATGELEPQAWWVFAVLFLWQHPHFYAIAWVHRDDYRQAGYRMLPPHDPQGARALRHILIYCALLLLVSLQPPLLGMTGPLYGWGAGGLGVAFCMCAWMLYRSGAIADARRLFRASIVYLPLWLLLTAANIRP